MTTFLGKIKHGLHLFILAMRELIKKNKLAEIEVEMKAPLLKLTFKEYLTQGVENSDVCYFIELYFQTMNIEVLTIEDQKYLS